MSHQAQRRKQKVIPSKIFLEQSSEGEREGERRRRRGKEVGEREMRAWVKTRGGKTTRLGEHQPKRPLRSNESLEWKGEEEEIKASERGERRREAIKEQRGGIAVVRR